MIRLTGSEAGSTPTAHPAGNRSICSHVYASGTVVKLTAKAASGSLFAGWSGPCAGTGACDVTMNHAIKVTA
jgi:hypothetical protein